MRILQRPQTIADALRDNTLTERDKLNFLWVILFINSLINQGSYLSTFFQLFQSPVFGLLNFLPLGITIWGILVCFRANRCGDNHHFLDRFLCLDAALSIRVYPFYFLLNVVSNIVRSLISLPNLSLLFFLVNSVAASGLTLYIYVRLRSLIADVASYQGAEM